MPTFRVAALHDILAIHKLDTACFRPTLDHWSKTHLINQVSEDGMVVLVAEGVEGAVVGFLVSDDAVIYKLAVAKESRKQGVGGGLLRFFLASRLSPAPLRAYIRHANLASQVTFAACGFIPAPEVFNDAQYATFAFTPSCNP